MGLKVFKTKISSITAQDSLRLDVKYRFFYDENQGQLCEGDKTIRIGDLIKLLPCKKKKKGELNDKCCIIDLSEVNDNTITLEEIVSEVDNIGSDKNILNTGEILISKIVMSKGYIFVNKNIRGTLIGSSEIIPYIKRDKKIDLDYLKYVLILKEMLNIYTLLETGKTPSQKRVNPRELLQIRIPDVPYTVQRGIGDEIRSIEKKNKKIRQEDLDFYKKIDDIFFEELKINKDALIFEKFYVNKNSFIGKDFDIRLSYKYNNKLFWKGIFTDYELISFRELLSEPMKMGKTISPNFYDEEGDAKYIAMSSIKKWQVDYDASKSISEEYYIVNQKNAKLLRNDILLARSGEGTIGKVALVKDDRDAVCADFIIRIRLKENINIEYMYYYMRSSLFQVFVNREKKGLGNNTNIFPKQINRIPIICATADQEERILNKIYNENKRINAAKSEMSDNNDKIVKMLWSRIK